MWSVTMRLSIYLLGKKKKKVNLSVEKQANVWHTVQWIASYALCSDLLHCNRNQLRIRIIFCLRIRWLEKFIESMRTNEFWLIKLTRWPKPKERQRRTRKSIVSFCQRLSVNSGYWECFTGILTLVFIRKILMTSLPNQKMRLNFKFSNV